MTTVQEILVAARAEIGSPGSCENPMGSNCGTKYHAWFGMQGIQWCAVWVSWLFRNCAGIVGGLRTYYSGDFLAWGQRAGRTVSIDQIRPGDIVIWDKPIGDITDHIGIVFSIAPTTFTTIEGNSGDCVRCNYDRPRVQTSSCHYYFVRPLYSETPEEEDMPGYNGVAKPGVGSGFDFNLVLNVDVHPDAAIKIYNGSPTQANITIGLAAQRYKYALKDGEIWKNIISKKCGAARGDIPIFVHTDDVPVSVTVE